VGIVGSKNPTPRQHAPVREFFETAPAAPFNTRGQVKVRDRTGAEYLLPFPCMKTDRGWFNAELGTALGKGIEVVGWRRRDFAK
jgi:hypothetical protein